MRCFKVPAIADISFNLIVNRVHQGTAAGGTYDETMTGIASSQVVFAQFLVRTETGVSVDTGLVVRFVSCRRRFKILYFLKILG